jgi:hypothetical protein
MTTLSEIKNYFGVKMATPNRNATVEVQLTQKEKQILFDIGLPEVNTGGGVDSLIFNDLSIYKDIYIPIYKSSLTPDDLWICLNTDTHEIASVSFGEIQEQPLSLESFLFYIYIYNKFIDEEEIQNNYPNDEDFTSELERRFSEHSQAYKESYWVGVLWELKNGNY